MKDEILNEKGQPMIVLAIGDVVGDPGLDILCRRLRKLKKEVGADLTVVIVNIGNAGCGSRFGDTVCQRVSHIGFQQLLQGSFGLLTGTHQHNAH